LAAVGDRCEDELDPDTDLSTVLDVGSDELPALDGEADVGSGLSCSLALQPRSTPVGAVAVLGLLGALFARRRTQCVKALGQR
jgi:MYXO-CTERM domain-containing protein